MSERETIRYIMNRLETSGSCEIMNSSASPECSHRLGILGSAFLACLYQPFQKSDFHRSGGAEKLKVNFSFLLILTYCPLWSILKPFQLCSYPSRSATHRRVYGHTFSVLVTVVDYSSLFGFGLQSSLGPLFSSVCMTFLTC